MRINIIMAVCTAVLVSAVSAWAAHQQFRVTVTGRDADDGLPMRVYVGSFDLGLLPAEGGEMVLDGPLGDEGDEDEQKLTGCIAVQASLMFNLSPVMKIEEHRLLESYQRAVHLRYAGTSVTLSQDLGADTWSFTIALRPACELRLRLLGPAGQTLSGLAWTGYGDGDTAPFHNGPSGNRTADGVQLKHGQARLLGIPRGDDLRVWVHAGDLGWSSRDLGRVYAFDPVDIAGARLEGALAEIDVPSPAGRVVGSGIVELTGWLGWQDGEEQELRSFAGPGSRTGELLWIRSDRQQMLWVKPPDFTLRNAPFMPAVDFRNLTADEESVVKLNCLKFNYSAALPEGTWDVVPGHLSTIDGMMLRKLLEKPTDHPGPFPGITRITVVDGETQSIDLGIIDWLPAHMLSDALWCGNESAWAWVPAGSGLLPIKQGDDEGDNPE